MTTLAPSRDLTWDDIFTTAPHFEIRDTFPDGRIKNGQLKLGDREFAVTEGIPRLIEASNYADNFGIQWNLFKQTQLDSYTRLPLTFDRFWHNTKWKPRDVYGKKILEVGSGAGRFSEVLLDAGAHLVSFDLSSAVDANFLENSQKGNMLLFQGSIYHLPLKDDFFDYVFCYGVLQHTPDPVKAFRAIFDKLRPGGSISIDYYLKTRKPVPWSLPKYVWRPITSRMDPKKLLKIVQTYVPLWLPIDSMIKRIPKIGTYLSSLTLIPCWNYLYLPLSRKQKVEWAIMDTFDALGAAYDEPKTLEEVREMVTIEGAEAIEVFYGSNGVVANVKKKAR